jgi:hypothetical protein
MVALISVSSRSSSPLLEIENWEDYHAVAGTMRASGLITKATSTNIRSNIILFITIVFFFFFLILINVGIVAVVDDRPSDD